MSFSREKTKDLYLLTTEVENLFITEYMAGAPGDFVKVYLYGLLCSEYGKTLSQREMTCREMSRQLGISESRVDEAWDYWHRAGIVNKKKLGQGPSTEYDIEFRNLRSLMYGSGSADAGQALSEEQTLGREQSFGREQTPGREQALPMYDDDLKLLAEEVENLVGKPLSPKETREVFSWVSDIGATEEVILAAAAYCVEKGKTGISYIAKVIAQWTADGYRTEEDVRRHLEEIGLRLSKYREILRALGMNRGATRAEQAMIDRWFGEMGFNREKVLEACASGSFIPNPNVRYVNGILEKWYEEARSQGRSVNSNKTVSKAVLRDYYDYLRRKEEAEAEERRQEVFEKLPRIRELDEEIAELNRKLLREMLSSDAATREKTNRLLELLRRERAVLLTENGFSADYTSVRYLCGKCRDTGTDDEGRQCSCAKERIREAELWQTLSSEKN